MLRWGSMVTDHWQEEQQPTGTPARGRRILTALAVLAALVVMAVAVRHCGFRSGKPVVAYEERTLMGTLWSIQVVRPPHRSETETKAALDLAFREVARIEEIMSEWKPDSPISAVNRAAGTGSIEVPQELADIVRRSIQWGEVTHGAFDITWRGLASLWRLEEGFVPPAEEEIQQRLPFVDYRRIQIEGNRIGLPAGFQIGLGGIAKGYAVDQAGAILSRQGFDDFLVNGGGDVLGSGSKNGTPWTIGIRDPRGGPSDLLGKLSLNGRAAVVTSGDYERYVMVDGVRYHHILDLRTGRPAALCRAVTVRASSAEDADVLATALFVLGPRDGLALAASRPGVDALIIDSQGQWWMTEGFRRDLQVLD